MALGYTRSGREFLCFMASPRPPCFQSFPSLSRICSFLAMPLQVLSFLLWLQKRLYRENFIHQMAIPCFRLQRPQMKSYDFLIGTNNTNLLPVSWGRSFVGFLWFSSSPSATALIRKHPGPISPSRCLSKASIQHPHFPFLLPHPLSSPDLPPGPGLDTLSLSPCLQFLLPLSDPLEIKDPDRANEKLTWRASFSCSEMSILSHWFTWKASLSCPVPHAIFRLVSNNYVPVRLDKKSLKVFCLAHVHSLVDAILLVWKVPTVHKLESLSCKASSSMKPLCVFVFSSFEFSLPLVYLPLTELIFASLSSFFLTLYALILCYIRRRHSVNVSIIWGHFSGWGDTGLDYFGPILTLTPPVPLLAFFSLYNLMMCTSSSYLFTFLIPNYFTLSTPKHTTCPSLCPNFPKFNCSLMQTGAPGWKPWRESLFFEVWCVSGKPNPAVKNVVKMNW